MPIFFLSLEPGPGICLAKETLYWSESCKNRLRRTAPCEPPGMATQVRPACPDATCVSPSPAGPPGSCPLHLLYLLNLSFMIGLPHRCCILELSANQCFLCNFLRVPRRQCQIAPKTHCLSCFTRNF